MKKKVYKVTSKTPKKKTAKAVKETKTIVLYILDESGSMAHNMDETIAGFNEYVRGIKEDKVSKNILMSFSKFGTRVSLVHNLVPIVDVPDISSKTYRPNGWTALFDSIGTTVKAFDDSIKKMKLKDYKVLVMVLTDGQENASTEYTQAAIRDLIKEKQKLGNWTFTYLGADQAAWITASNLGISRGNTIANYNTGLGVTVNKNTRARTIAYAGGQHTNSSNFLSNFSVDAVETKNDIPALDSLDQDISTTGVRLKKATK